MLPGRLLDLRRTEDGRLVPRWLLPRDEPWLRELVHEVRAASGQAVGPATERIVEVVAPLARRHGASRRVVEGAWLLERRRWTLRTAAPVPPRTIRRVVFALAAERSREEALATAASELGIASEDIEKLLFADRAEARLLVQPAESSSVHELAAAYNLAVVQSLLARAVDVIAIVRSNARRVVGHAKLLGLMATFEDVPDGAMAMRLSGPMALFHETVKYGNAIARWFPSLVTTQGWSLAANVLVGDDRSLFELDATAPLPRTHAMPRAHDSRLEAQLDVDLRALGSPWRVEREVAVVRVERPDGERCRLFFPDFALVSERGRVLVEIAGWWTDEYMADKRAMMAAAREPIVLCVDERRAGPDVGADPRIVRYRKRVDARDVVRACEAALAARCATDARGGRV